MIEQDLHPAVRAFAKLQRRPVETTPPRLLSDEKALVFLFDHEGAEIVAKQSQRETAAVEAAAYGRILPGLDLPSVKFYGLVPDVGGDWLFMEAAGGAPYRSERVEHRQIAAEWIGAMHVRASTRLSPVRLPDRSPESYFRQLKDAIAAIRLYRDHPYITAAIRLVLDEMLDLLRTAEAQWDEIAAACAMAPLTFVHADLQPKNLYIRPAATPRFVAIDWEHSGWGTPAADLPYLDPEAYSEAVRKYWPNLTPSATRRLQRSGRLLQLVAAVEWDACCLPYEDGTNDMGWYGDRLAEELKGMRCE